MFKKASPVNIVSDIIDLIRHVFYLCNVENILSALALLIGSFQNGQKMIN